ncbi:MAG TPA: TauD/TfdA family dioxygenase [Stellaceae bacterium]|jgi:taurine dioxygenase|nr:TauD/TfdA family dioxygenase [Stellaceae bacterium]
MTIYTLMPLHESLGLAVIGVDLGEPIDPETGEDLSRLLAEHLVLVFPQQLLTPEQYLTAAAAFGPPMRQHYSQPHVPGYPDIGLVRHRDGQHMAETWHTDHPNRECPPAATMLYGVEISSSGGGTSIANMRAAYWGLPEGERRHLETLRTVNSLDTGRAEDRAKYGEPVVHPMVRTHPVNRERAVYFHPTKTRYIEGMTPQASQKYLDDLVARMIQPEIVYRHAWQKGDVLVIDDRAALHRAHDDYDHSESRVLWRIIVEGDRPILV